MKCLGLDLGSSAVKLALVDTNGLCHSGVKAHTGAVLPTLTDLLDELSQRYPELDEVLVSVVGTNAVLLEELGLQIESDVEALAAGAQFCQPDARSIIDIGSEGAKYIFGFCDGHMRYSMNESCAAGTGAFFEAQMNRLELPLDEYSAMVDEANSVPRIAGRCSVFAKTDITHLQQEGVASPDILLGLCYAVARNFRASVIGKNEIQLPMLLCGGTANNRGMVRALKELLRLGKQELVVPQNAQAMAAIGAALFAKEQGQKLKLDRLVHHVSRPHAPVASAGLSPLGLPHSAPDDMHRVHPFIPHRSYSLGVDVGSTTTKLVLINAEAKPVDYQYLRTKGEPFLALRLGLESLRERFGANLHISSLGVTGSGRQLIGKTLEADLVQNEISAQAASAIAFAADADTVFEIGGQDSKYIRIENGQVADFQMNKICAAGTGSFVEEQAALLGIPLDEYCQQALSAQNPVNLGERCTVFMESAISTELARGRGKDDIAAGICYSVVQNYLSKVVANKPVGSNIVLLGGVAHNPAIVAAFQRVFGRKLSVGPFFSVSGALGAAVLSTKHEIGGNQRRQGRTLAHLLHLVNTRNEPGNPVASSSAAASARTIDVAHSGRKPSEPENSSTKTVVGIPRVLFNNGYFSLFQAFFQALGYEVRSSSPSDQQTVERSQLYAAVETCFPLKLGLGHTEELIEGGANIIFMPSVYTLAAGKTSNTTEPKPKNCACVYMQKAPQMISSLLSFSRRGVRLLAPDLYIDRGLNAMQRVLEGSGQELGHSRLSSRRAAQQAMIPFRQRMAMMKGMRAKASVGGGASSLKGHSRAGVSPLDTLPLEEGHIGFVLISRGYAVADAKLSLGLEGRLKSLGYPMFNLAHIGAHQASHDGRYDDVPWPFGRHILAGADIVRSHPQLFAIYLTYHGCGPDGMIAHAFEKRMAPKPFLSIEVDEHASDVGIITRLEAFIESVKSGFTQVVPADVDGKADRAHGRQTERVLLPNLEPYSSLASAALAAKGFHSRVFEPSDSRSLELGRQQTLGKEYFSFTSFMGDVLRWSHELDSGQHGAPSSTVFWPLSGEAEADGQYARIIAEKLALSGNPRICNVPLTDLLKQAQWARAAFRVVLAGDILVRAREEIRCELEKEVVAAIAQSKLTRKKLEAWADRVGETKQANRAADILLVGEIGTLYNAIFLAELRRIAEGWGGRLRFEPLSEALLFFWAQHRGLRNPLINEMEGEARNIWVRIDSEDCYRPALRTLNLAADRWLGAYDGALGRYRAAKIMAPPRDAAGIISVSSMYENTAAVLDTVLEQHPKPTLTIGFDGKIEGGSAMRLRSFAKQLR